MPAYPPPTKMNVRTRRLRSASRVDSAMSMHSRTRLRIAMASSMVLKPVPSSASPGIGSVREIEPGATTTCSYGSSYGRPSSGWMRGALAGMVQARSHDR